MMASPHRSRRVELSLISSFSGFCALVTGKWFRPFTGKRDGDPRPLWLNIRRAHTRRRKGHCQAEVYHYLDQSPDVPRPGWRILATKVRALG
ncbi:hypothetical protein E2C01_056984 [Portunus trituberculatus]|uniref:Uncharacterized protein n=1 Tax=Portunus trituberculatus TaxID=210409 RepID=A0A5B7H236_PORTR|nr:hypothetical protein [Portunus trituberculatus]